MRGKHPCADGTHLQVLKLGVFLSEIPNDATFDIGILQKSTEEENQRLSFLSRTRTIRQQVGHVQRPVDASAYFHRRRKTTFPPDYHESSR